MFLTAHTIRVVGWSQLLGDKSVKTHAVASDGDFWIAKVISTISQLEEDKKHVALLEDVEEEEQSLRMKAKETVESLRKVKFRKKIILALGINFCYGRFQAISKKRPEERNFSYLAFSSNTTVQKEMMKTNIPMLLRWTWLLDALYCCSYHEQTCIDSASRMLLAEKNMKTKEPSKDAVDEPVDVLVDTIIGYLEKSTAYIRTVGNQVFSLLSGSVKDTTIDLILAVRQFHLIIFPNIHPH